MAKSTPAQSDTSSQPAPGAKVPKHRSPNYPALPLDKAVARAAKAYAEYKRHLVPLKDGMAQMGYSSESSTGQQALAALRYFGLVEIEGIQDKRQIRVSERAAKIAANHSDRDRLIQEAAMLPSINKEIWNKFYTEDGLAPDATIRQYLVWDRPDTRFTDESAAIFLSQFKQTIAFAKLGESGKIADEGFDSGAADENEGLAGDGSLPPPPKPPMTPPMQPLPLTDAIPLAVLLESGGVQVVNVPRMLESELKFFEDLLKTYRKAIVRAEPSPATKPSRYGPHTKEMGWDDESVKGDPDVDESVG